MKSIFYHFWWAIIELNLFLEGESPTFNIGGSYTLKLIVQKNEVVSGKSPGFFDRSILYSPFNF